MGFVFPKDKSTTPFPVNHVAHQLDTLALDTLAAV